MISYADATSEDVESSSHSLLEKEDGYEARPNGGNKLQKILLWAAPLLIVSNMMTFVGTSLFYQRPSKNLIDPRHEIYDSVNWGLHDVRFSGFTLNATIYTDPPSDAVDAAWTALGPMYDFLLLPKKYAEEFRITPDHLYYKLDDHEQGYPVNVEALHQLHCVNLLRKGLFHNYDYYHARGGGAFSDPKEYLVAHLGHCIDMLRQLIMCNADTGLTPYLDQGGVGHILPDFTVPRKCRDFESLRVWAEKHQSIITDEQERKIIEDLHKNDVKMN